MPVPDSDPAFAGVTDRGDLSYIIAVVTLPMNGERTKEV